ncbi:MAG: flagellar hook-length control protein FliK [Treponemataceae bacterium]|nr:flagellar hook-length control protein FliK [Treponemataceae bacterium]
MYPLNFQPVQGDSLNLLSVDSGLQLAQGKSNAVPVETSFSSYMERAAQAESTDGNTQTQTISQTAEPVEAEAATEVSEAAATEELVPVTDESLMAFENQLARMTGVAELEPFSLEVSFDDEGQLYSGVQIAFAAQSETDFDAAVDRFLGFTEDLEEPETTENSDLVMQENLAAVITVPSQPVFQQDLNTHTEIKTESDELSSLETGKKVVKGKKTSTIMDSISVVDERTADIADTADAGKTVTMTSFDGKHSAEMSLNLAQNAEQQYFQDNQTGAYTGTIEAGLTSNDFATMISDEISNNADEFVKAGSIVLKNDNKGSINLILHPEELGNVKIHLELSDNQITGKIVVASKEAYDAFKQSMNDLKQAFVASGFDTNGFDLTWTGSQGSNQQGYPENQDRVYENLNAAIARHTADSYMDNMPMADMDDSAGSTTYINLVA